MSKLLCLYVKTIMSLCQNYYVFMSKPRSVFMSKRTCLSEFGEAPYKDFINLLKIFSAYIT